MELRFGAIAYAEPRGEQVYIKTTPCCVCGKQHEFLVIREGYELWQTGTGPSSYIQNALPELSIIEREILISGTCGPCFDELFPPEEEE